MSEASEAKRDGATLQRNSGRGKIQKGDAKLFDMLVDYKEYNKSFSISQAMWSKICTDAMRVGIEWNPALKLIIGSKPPYVRLAVIAWDHLMSLYEEIKYLKEEITALTEEVDRLREIEWMYNDLNK